MSGVEKPAEPVESAHQATRSDSAERYTLHIALPGRDDERVLSIWGLESAPHRAAARRVRYEWFYRNNPQGAAEENILVESASGNDVGFVGVGARTLLLNGEPVRAGVLVDFMVDKRHRTVLPALQLQRWAHRRAMETKSLLYGIPNEQAQRVCKRVGFNSSFDVNEYCRVLRLRRYARRYLPAWAATLVALVGERLISAAVHLQLLACRYSVTWCADIDSELDWLWDSADKQGLCIGVRDSEFLRWRFGRELGTSCRILKVRDPQGTLIGWFLCDTSGEDCLVKDCLIAGGAAEWRNALLALSFAAFKSGATAVRLDITPVKCLPRILRRAQFLLRGRRLCFVATRPELLDRVSGLSWYITQADEDM